MSAANNESSSPSRVTTTTTTANNNSSNKKTPLLPSPRPHLCLHPSYLVPCLYPHPVHIHPHPYPYPYPCSVVQFQRVMWQPTYTRVTVDTLQACGSAVAQLEQEAVLAVDTEGVNLSRTGPITLVQVATTTSAVFLFDVMKEPRMFSDEEDGGGLRRLLESETIVKVLHSAKNDAEALWFQHEVELRNVHDTQVAHRMLQTFPRRARLADMCTVYCPQKASLLETGKEVVALKMTRMDGEYWARRPLTQEMIDYAAYDVIALVPEVYKAQKQLLEDMDLTEAFRTNVDRELKAVKDPMLSKELQQEENDFLVSILKEFSDSAPHDLHFQDITDSDVTEALKQVRLLKLSKSDLPPLVMELKLQEMEAWLLDVQTEFYSAQQGSISGYNPHSVSRQLNAFSQNLREPHKHPAQHQHKQQDHADRLQALKTRAQKLQAQLDIVLLEDLVTKYTPSTPVKHLAQSEKGLIKKKVQPRSERDPTIHPTLLSLYWNIRLEQLDEVLGDLNADPQGYEVWDRYLQLVRSFVDAGGGGGGSGGSGVSGGKGGGKGGRGVGGSSGGGGGDDGCAAAAAAAAPVPAVLRERGQQLLDRLAELGRLPEHKAE